MDLLRKLVIHKLVIHKLVIRKLVIRKLVIRKLVIRKLVTGLPHNTRQPVTVRRWDTECPDLP
jgi:hypothetical protein